MAEAELEAEAEALAASAVKRNSLSSHTFFLARTSGVQFAML